MTATGPNPASGVLVAVDGSEQAGRALAWAVREAGLRGRGLTIAHAYHWPSSGFSPVEAVGYLMDALEQDSAEIVAEAAKAARQLAPDLPVQTESRPGPPVAVLVELSHEHELAVVGSRGLGGFTGMLLGSVGTGLVANAACSVAVVRGEREPAADDPVVAGVDGSPAAEMVLTEAFRAAQRRDCPLIAVHGWQDPTTDVLTARGQQPDFDRDSWQRAAAQALSERLDLVGQQFPSVHADAVVDWGRPTRALLEQAHTAQLVVVGTRGRGELAGMLLGSTSRAMVQHAPCPVIVVRAPENPER
jgi:nucleotide-binding universal stress UspA family protein